MWLCVVGGLHPPPPDFVLKEVVNGGQQVQGPGREAEARVLYHTKVSLQVDLQPWPQPQHHIRTLAESIIIWSIHIPNSYTSMIQGISFSS